MQPLTDLRPNGSTRYVSRWHQILEAHNRVRTRLFNSLELLEGTDLALFVINEATHPASLVQAAGTAQGGSAVAAGKAGARQVPVLHTAAASLAEPPFSGRPPTPPGLSAHRRHQWPGDREAPSHLIVRHRRDNLRRSGIAPSPAGLRRRRPIRAWPTSPTGTRAPVLDDGLVQAERRPPPRCAHPQGAEDSVLQEVPPADRLGWPLAVQGADLLPVHPRADTEGRVAGTSTDGKAQVEFPPLRPSLRFGRLDAAISATNRSAKLAIPSTRGRSTARTSPVRSRGKSGWHFDVRRMQRRRRSTGETFRCVRALPLCIHG
ncbi:hypothetical protein NP493_87g02011 [Ridgeia piscesae]|uniref:Uncharacterized protein n=1 Tax=Ridgeia piscesae TaxID=27915 RepID=A0AAD9P8H5_RIDPI|nr:hypothetical protein NP493_87g02011 [Ridgeia piscesae]